MKPALELVRRAEITQLTLDRFKERPFRFGAGDCVQMTAFHLRGMGHQVLLSKGGQYRTGLGAVRALRRAGFASLSEALDEMGLARIAPAAALTGDVLALPHEEGSPLEALTIALGNGRVLGWHAELAGAAVLQPVQFVTAWRVPWLRS
ncbi:hypothetical protein [Roseisolibacter sp. H3M3-2]|uniref:DUF6950 family protein n=1 Tax=Roseisolibacter sp. H3M3-2 TaxID=3031323 RepID=UPI0023DBF9BA|nr:hypothetical protein [Roseisolibacter sp. H3M3-2]MDF1506493.1 hypothetical protein [Roseisolibacter sp. H3M3-2]